MSQEAPEQDTFSQRLATELESRGLRVPVLILLAAGRPLTFLLGQAVWIAQPAASLLWPRSRLAALASLLEDEQAVTQLQDYLSRQDKDE